MIDVKKLITGFLILAVAAGFSGLVLAVVSNSSTAVANTAPQVTIAGSDDATVGGNAFTPTEINQIVADVAPELASSTMEVSSTDPSNLTDDLAAEFVNGVVAANPTGPTGTDSDGNPTFTPPDVNALAANIADTTTTANLQIPNWNVEADAIPVTIIPSSAAALTNYGDALNDVLNNHLNGAQVQSIVSDQTDAATASDLTYVESQIEGALQDTASLKVPAPAEAYQKSLLTELVYEKNMVALNDLAQTDPVKASLIFQQEDQKFSAVQQNLLTQAQELTNNDLSLQQTPVTQHGGMMLSFIDNTFGIPKAQALLPVFDPATWGLIEANQASNIASELEAILKNTLLQILKNTLIALIQREVLTWVQGSGAPRFITNWGTQLVNAAQTSALNAINAQMSCGTFPAFIGQEKITLNSFYTNSNNSCANQFAAALGSNSFQQFYNNFKNGGFIAFGASTLPSGNPYGSLFFNAQTVAFAYSGQQAASQLQAQANQGLKGSQVCSDGSDPTNGQHTTCESATDDYLDPNGQTTCDAGYNPVVYDNDGLCANGDQPEVTTPAAATGFALLTAEGAPSQQTTAATDIVGVINSVLSSLLLSLANTAVNAAGQLVNQGLTSLNSANITGGGTPPAPTPLACNPTTQTVPLGTGNNGVGGSSTSSAPISLSATGGTTDSSGDLPIYNWVDSSGVTSTGAFFLDTFTNPGSYTVTLSDSANDTPATCNVTVQP